MDSRKITTRRGVLAAGTFSAGAAVLAGCGLDGSCEWGEESATPAAGGVPHVLARLADITVGGMVSAKAADGKPVIVTRPTDATAAAFSAICPHKGCLVEPDGDRFRCPPHDGVFDQTTGKVLDGPPKKSLRRIDVTLVDGDVVMAG